MTRKQAAYRWGGTVAGAFDVFCWPGELGELGDPCSSGVGSTPTPARFRHAYCPLLADCSGTAQEVHVGCLPRQKKQDAALFQHTINNLLCGRESVFHLRMLKFQVRVARNREAVGRVWQPSTAHQPKGEIRADKLQYRLQINKTESSSGCTLFKSMPCMVAEACSVV